MFVLIHKNVKNRKIFVWFSGWTHLKCERTTALRVKLNTWACRGIPQANIWSECPMYGKRKSGVFFAVRVGFHVSFLEISQRRHTQHSNLQVTITVTCLNFAVTVSRILLPAVSSCRRVKPSRKIALNSNGEVNCRELAQRPCTHQVWAPWEPLFANRSPFQKIKETRAVNSSNKNSPKKITQKI